METFISPNNTWALMAITCGWVAFSIYAEQTWQWAAKLSGAIIALIGAVFLTNLKIIPTNAPWFDTIIWGYVVPMAIPLLLLQCDIRKIWKESGRLLVLFLIGSAATASSAVLAYHLLRDSIPSPEGVATMMTGTYIGGGVNFATLAGAFKIPSEVVAATTVADNMIMALYFLVLIGLPSIAFFRSAFPHPHIDEVEKSGVSEGMKTQAASYWEKKPISLKDIAFNIAVACIIVCVSEQIAKVIADAIEPTNFFTSLMNGMFGNKYLIITTLAMLVATFGSKQVEELSGSQELGTFLIYLFLFVIGVPASIMTIIQSAPMLFVFCLIMVVINLVVTLIFGKLLGFDLEEIIMASNANIGGPTTAAAMAISRGWVRLVGPVMLIGTLGYVLGTYAGIFVGQLLGLAS